MDLASVATLGIAILALLLSVWALGHARSRESLRAHPAEPHLLAHEPRTVQSRDEPWHTAGLAVQHALPGASGLHHTLATGALRGFVSAGHPGDAALLLESPVSDAMIELFVHLGPRIGLDLVDGRTVPVDVQAERVAWSASARRRAAVGRLTLAPEPGSETLRVRVSGQLIRCGWAADEPETLRITVEGLEEDAIEADAQREESIAHAVSLAIRLSRGRTMRDVADSGYPLAAWSALTHTWIEMLEGNAVQN